jgi:hypothetical protein
MVREKPPYFGEYDKKTGLDFYVDGERRHAGNVDLKFVGRISAYHESGEQKTLEQLEQEAFKAGATVIAGVPSPEGEERDIKLKPNDRNAYWLFGLRDSYMI